MYFSNYINVKNIKYIMVSFSKKKKKGNNTQLEVKCN